MVPPIQVLWLETRQALKRLSGFVYHAPKKTRLNGRVSESVVLTYTKSTLLVRFRQLFDTDIPDKT